MAALAGAFGLGCDVGRSEGVTPAVGAPYRLELARRSLGSARDNFARDNWRDSALFSRAAVEHAAKAIVACFAAVPRTHEPARLMELALSAEAFPERLRATAEALVPGLSGFGLQDHILLSYGDEEHGVDPWSLVDRAHSESHLRAAEAMLALADACVIEMTRRPSAI
jgi:HEPN domain-containing protein